MTSDRGERRLKVRVKDKRKSQSSRKWLERQLNDPYVARAKREGFRSRAAFKLIEIDDKHRLFKPGGRVADLGAAPGGLRPRPRCIRPSGGVQFLLAGEVAVQRADRDVGAFGDRTHLNCLVPTLRRDGEGGVEDAAAAFALRGGAGFGRGGRRRSPVGGVDRGVAGCRTGHVLSNILT